MDWSKAKTILIVAFIITNILLAYVVINEKPVDESTIKDEFVEDVVRLLKDKNISIATQIPKEVPYLNTMIVGYEKLSINELNKNFFNTTGNVNDDRDGFGTLENGNESVAVFNNKLIIYENKEEKEIYKDLNEEKTIQLAEEFIKKKGFDISDMKLNFIKEDKGTFYLEYSKVYNDIYVEKAYTNLQIDKRGIKRFERQWLKVRNLGETKIYINTAPKSVLALLGMEEVYGKTITDISLCYYFDPQKHDYLKEPGKARQGKAIPAWRIQFDDGYKVYIDEY
jgi:regulatory protein YycI of two-component signal transduction system YycFG